jgi:hypothetical protein
MSAAIIRVKWGILEVISIQAFLWDCVKTLTGHIFGIWVPSCLPAIVALAFEWAWISSGHILGCWNTYSRGKGPDIPLRYGVLRCPLP